MRIGLRLGWDPVQTAFCVLVALTLALVVRPITADLTTSVGTMWPFSLANCSIRSTPGCGQAFAAPPHGRFGLATR